MAVEPISSCIDLMLTLMCPFVESAHRTCPITGFSLLLDLHLPFKHTQGEPSDLECRTSQQKRSIISRIGWQSELPDAITNLSGCFPLSSSVNNPDVNLDYLINSFVPPWIEACRLCELYLEQAPWFFGAVTEKQLREEILPLWYPEAPRSAISANLSRTHETSDSGPPVTPSKGAHDLALLFIIFCFGAYTDISLPPAPDNPDSELYFQLTRATLALEPVLERPPSVATVQTLSLMAIYQGMCSGENSIESTWALMGMATKLAQSVRVCLACTNCTSDFIIFVHRSAFVRLLCLSPCRKTYSFFALQTGIVPDGSCPQLKFKSDGLCSGSSSSQTVGRCVLTPTDNFVLCQFILIRASQLAALLHSLSLSSIANYLMTPTKL
jgi:hypothetical protein